MMDETLIIIPTYNEAKNAPLMIETLFSLYPEVSLLIVDDNSPDNTGPIVQALKKKYQKLYLLNREEKLGLGTAYIAGFNLAISHPCHYIVQMDCDFSHDPKDVKKLVESLISENADLAIGSRYVDRDIRTRNWSFLRLCISYIGAFFLRTLSGLNIRDTQGGFKAFKRSTLERIDLNHIISKGYIFQFEINYKISLSGMKIIEFPIVFTERLHGQSKMSIKIILEAIKVFFILHFQRYK